MKNILEALQWRYATKTFDPNKKVSQEHLDILLETLRLSPSSFGLQPRKFIQVKNPELRKQLQAASRGQPQIVDASDLIIIASKTDMGKEDVEEYLEHLKETRMSWIDINSLPQQEIDALMNYKNMMIDTLESRNPDQRKSRSQKQAYIAMGIFLLACAEMEIDACPMEGFDPSKYNEILGLNELWLTATVAIPVGYRAVEDKYASLAKVRFPKEKIFIQK
jgi:nitroreductase / dihydropteridine reductase